MTIEEKIFLTLIGPEGVMQSLEEKRPIQGMVIGKLQPLDAMVDAVDAPLSSEEIKMIMEFATATLTFGTAALELIKALKDALLKFDSSKNSRIIILNARTNVELISITNETDVEKATAVIESLSRK